MDCMRKVFLSLLVALLAYSLAGCLPSFDAEAEEHFWQGIEYTKQGNNDLAMEEFTKAIEIDPDYSYAYYNRALAYYRKGELENSLMDYNKAIELNPDNPYWTIERGFLHMELGDREKAIIDLERSKELGVPYEYRQRVEEALAQLKP
jgi:tetratricopeptide (TPR) repeat protein